MWVIRYGYLHKLTFFPHFLEHITPELDLKQHVNLQLMLNGWGILLSTGHTQWNKVAAYRQGKRCILHVFLLLGLSAFIV